MTVKIEHENNMYNVYGVSKNINREFILHYSTFREWGNFYIEDFGDCIHELVAHILYEATYISFKDEEIIEECLKHYREGGLYEIDCMSQNIQATV